MADPDGEHTGPVETKADTSGKESTGGIAPSRRQALKHLAYAASVAPAMVVLLSGSAAAQGWNGKGKGNGNGGGGPNCDNPGISLGFNRNGHSAC
jgi:hypothetical protein